MRELSLASKLMPKKRDEISKNCITEKNTRKSTSEVWKTFCLLLNIETHETVKGWAQCILCQEFAKYNGVTTSGLKAHKCEKTQRDLTSFFEPSSSSSSTKITFTKNDFNVIRDATIKFVAKDIRPISAIDGRGIRDLIYEMVSIGIKYPKITISDIDRLLPSPRTLGRHLVKRAELSIDKIKYDLNRALNTVGTFSSSIDLYKDRYQSISYLGISCKYNIYENDCIVQKEIIIHVDNVDEEKITGIILRNKIEKVYGEFGLTVEQIRQNIVWITDRGGNVKNSLADFNVRLNCYAHLINNIVKHMCGEETVAKIIKNASSVVKFFKKSVFLTKDLEEALRSHCETRWNNNYYLLLSVSNNYNAMYDILRRKEECRPSENLVQKITCINKNEITQVTSVLKLFADITIQIQAEKYETLHLIWPYYLSIEEHLKGKPDDSPFIDRMKAKGREYIAKNTDDIKPQFMHKLAVFLHPAMKNSNIFKDEERSEIYGYIRAHMSGIVAENVPTSMEMSFSNHNTSITNESLERRGVMNDVFIDFLNPIPGENTSVADELDNYISFAVVPVSY